MWPEEHHWWPERWHYYWPADVRSFEKLPTTSEPVASSMHKDRLARWIAYIRT